MKRVILFILAVATVMSLATCSTVASAEAVKDEEVRFQYVEQCTVASPVYTNIYIFVDTHTGVLYLGCMASNHSFMTALVNADGTPMIWEGWEK